MATRVILHVDMDAFFASVEQREHPEYCGKPVVVGADPKGGKGRGVVAACSYEARKFGIHSAMPIGRAFRLCPQAIFVRPDGARYAHVSRSVMKILRRYTDLVEPISIDEAFLDVTGSQRIFGKPTELAIRIKTAVWDEQKLTCSIGIAPNKFLAKIASDTHKPSGLFEVVTETEKEFLGDLPVGRLWGVGPKTEERLRFLGVQTIGDVASRPAEFWAQRFGRHGLYLWELSHGLDDRPVQPSTGFSSLSQERTFGEDTADVEKLKTTLLALSEELAFRARKHDARARSVSLKLRHADFSTFTRQKTLPECSNDAGDIYAVAWNLLQSFFPLSQKIRLLGIGLSQFQPRRNRQLCLFGDEQKRKDQLDATVDAIVAKFGKESITKGSLMDTPLGEDEGFSSFLSRGRDREKEL